MSDNHNLLNDNDMCSFLGHEAEDMCFNCGNHPLRGSVRAVKEIKSEVKKETDI